MLADIGHGIAARRELPAIVALSVNAAAPTVTLIGATPIEERDPSKAVSGKPTDMGGGEGEESRGPSASAEAESEDPSGCGWKLTYDSELNRVFLDLLERDTDALVMRMPRESLIKFLRSASDFASAWSERSDAQYDAVA